MELLTFQAIVRCHIHTQDNLFTIRIVQILLYHYINYDEIYEEYMKQISSDTDGNSCGNTNVNIYSKLAVRSCLLYMMKSNVNIVRAIRIGAYLSAKGVDSMSPPFCHYELHPILSTLDGSSAHHSYVPV